MKKSRFSEVCFPGFREALSWSWRSRIVVVVATGDDAGRDQVVPISGSDGAVVVDLGEDDGGRVVGAFKRPVVQNHNGGTGGPELGL